MVFFLADTIKTKSDTIKKSTGLMPKRIPPLTATQVSKAKPKEKEYKLSDGGGLHLLVTPSGGKLWRLQYRFNEKQKTLAFGQYPEISLSDARERREVARKLLANGQDPNDVKKSTQGAATVHRELSFEQVAREWFKKNEPAWSCGHSAIVMSRLERDVFPEIGSKPVTEITASDIREILLRIDARGATETAYRIKVVCGQVFRYAVATGRLEYDPSAALRPREILRKRKIKHHAAVIDPEELAPLLRAIDGYQGTIIVKSALQLAPMLFVRPGELQKAEWAEIDFEAALWSIGPERMKMKAGHLVPLPSQALKILHDLKAITGGGRYVFAGRTSTRPMSNNAVNAALRYLGYDCDTATAHGFRATARTILDEVLGFRVDLIEHQLAHQVADPLGRAYNRTSFLDDRRKMMQRWADYLDELKASN